MPMPPGPLRSPLANLRRFVRDPYAVFWDAAAEYGPVFGFRIAGWPAWVSVGEPELIERIFRGTGEELHGAGEIMRHTLPPGVLALLEGEAHRGERMSGYARPLRAAVDAALEQVRPGQRVVLTELLGRITARTIVECVFGIRDPERRDRLLALIEADAAHERVAIWPVATTLLGGEPVRAFIEGSVALGRASPLRFARTKHGLRALIADEIARCRRAPDGRDDVLARLLAAGHEQGDGLAADELHAQLMAIVLAGLDASASSLAWALYFLLTHRDVREHVLAEIAERQPGAWTSAVIDETLRIRPIAHHTARRLAVDLQLGAWTLPAGTYTLPAQAIAHFRADLWTNPHEFRPERFLPGRGAAPSPCVYFPFGDGTRSCLGRAFALVQMREILARLLARVELRLAVDANPRPALQGLLVGPSDGVPVFIERVRPASVD